MYYTYGYGWTNGIICNVIKYNNITRNWWSKWTYVNRSHSQNIQYTNGVLYQCVSNEGRDCISVAIHLDDVNERMNILLMGIVRLLQKCYQMSKSIPMRLMRWFYLLFFFESMKTKITICCTHGCSPLLAYFLTQSFHFYISLVIQFSLLAHNI